MLTRALIFLLVATLATCQLYDVFKSDVAKLTKKNWSAQVTTNRQNGKIFIVHFYNNDDGQSYKFSKDFDKKASEMKGVLHFGFVNCSENKDVCAAEKLAKVPGLKVYPPIPIPPTDLELDVEKAVRLGASYIQSYVTEVTDETAPGFLGSDVIVPKVLLFTDKKGLPLMYRSLSNSFNAKMNFGIVRSDQKEIAATYNIKSFPKLVLVKPGHKKPHFFDKEFNFNNLKDFLNIFSEQFVPKSNEKISDTKPWLFEAIPELSGASAKEICTGLDKTLCVILFHNGQPPKETIDMLKDLKSTYDSNMNAFALKFSWIDSSKHSDWNSKLEVADGSAPTIRILNPGRRKRFVKLEDAVSKKGLENLFEKIFGGDARFTNLKGEIPEFAVEEL